MTLLKNVWVKIFFSIFFQFYFIFFFQVKKPEERPSSLDLISHPLIQKAKGPAELRNFVIIALKAKFENEKKEKRDSREDSGTDPGSTSNTTTSQKESTLSSSTSSPVTTRGRTTTISINVGTVVINEGEGTVVVKDKKDNVLAEKKLGNEAQGLEFLSKALENSKSDQINDFINENEDYDSGTMVVKDDEGYDSGTMVVKDDEDYDSGTMVVKDDEGYDSGTMVVKDDEGYDSGTMVVRGDEEEEMSGYGTMVVKGSGDDDEENNQGTIFIKDDYKNSVSGTIVVKNESSSPNWSKIISSMNNEDDDDDGYGTIVVKNEEENGNKASETSFLKEDKKEPKRVNQVPNWSNIISSFDYDSDESIEENKPITPKSLETKSRNTESPIMKHLVRGLSVGLIPLENENYQDNKNEKQPKIILEGEDTVAIKKLNMDASFKNSTNSQLLMHELISYKCMEHKALIKFYGFSKEEGLLSEGNISFILEGCFSQNLLSVALDTEINLSKELKSSIVSSIASGMSYICENFNPPFVIKRTFTSMDVLLTSLDYRKRITAKLYCFPRETLSIEEESFEDWNWRSPEEWERFSETNKVNVFDYLVKRDQSGKELSLEFEKSCVYNLACIITEMCNRSLPFQRNDNPVFEPYLTSHLKDSQIVEWNNGGREKVYKEIVINKQKPVYSENDFSLFYKEVLDSALDSDASKRPNLEKFIQGEKALNQGRKAIKNSLITNKLNYGILKITDLPEKVDCMVLCGKLIFISQGKTVSVWDTEKVKLVNTLPTVHSDSITCLLRKKGKVWCSSDDSTISVWSIANLKLKQILKDHKRSVKSLQKTGDNASHWVISGDLEGKFFIWSKRKIIRTIELGSPIHSLCFVSSPFVFEIWIGSYNTIFIFDIIVNFLFFFFFFFFFSNHFLKI